MLTNGGKKLIILPQCGNIRIFLSLILCEIDFVDFGCAKSAILTHLEAFEIEVERAKARHVFLA